MFPECFHGFCMFYMKFNLLDKLKGIHSSVRNSLVDKFSQCVYAVDYEEYIKRLDSLIKKGGQRVRDFVKDIPIQHWVNAVFPGQRYGEKCSSLAESWNKMIDEARHMPIPSMIDSIRVQSMEDMAEKRDECKK